MTYLSPPLWAKGRYQVTSPYLVSPAKIYQCIALRDFEDIFAESIDVYEVYYEPYGVEATKYRADLKDNVVIVTLADEFGELLYIPSSYITSFPTTGQVPYKHIVLSCSLGPVPDYLDISTLQEVIETAVTETVGIQAPKVNIHAAPSKNAISPSEHDALEAARTAAITYNETYKAKYLKAEQQKVELQEKVNILTQILIDNDLLN